MSEIGGSEVLLLIIIGLIVLGPERLPRVANQLGSWLGQARRMTRMMRRQLEEEVNFDLKKEMGLEETDKPSPSYRSPQFVQDRQPPKQEESAPEPELPDDYSPAHAKGEKGTGVEDVADAIDELPPSSAHNDADAGDAEEPPSEPKTQSA